MAAEKFTRLENLEAYLKGICLEPKIEGDYLKISLADKDTILSWSYGEVKKHETYNFRILKPERDGLFCPKIFGPIKDYGCLCITTKGKEYEGKVCKICGVKITTSEVREKRMGHISLAAPVVHPLFIEHLAENLNFTLDELKKIIYYDGYLVLNPGKTNFDKYQIISKEEYEEYSDSKDIGLKVGKGAEALEQMLKEMDSEKASKLKKTILHVIPIIPPGKRDAYFIWEGYGIALHDINDLYRRLIYRNNRLSCLMELDAPTTITDNEKSWLQEEVNDTFIRGKEIEGKRLRSILYFVCSSLSYFWKKSLDYVGTGVIVSDSKLNREKVKINIDNLIELYEPLLLNNKNEREELRRNPKAFQERLKEQISSRPLLFTYRNKAIAAWAEPWEYEAVALSPEVCRELGIEMKGEKIQFHLPLSEKAVEEAKSLVGRILEGDGKVESVFSDLKEKIIEKGFINYLADIAFEEKPLPLSEIDKIILNEKF